MLKIKAKIKNEENIFFTEIRNAKNSGKAVYILGAANGGQRIATALISEGGICRLYN